jgi:hypothetical protein
MAVSKSKKKNPMLTKNGKPRLGPLNIAQLTKMLDETSKPKIKAKIKNAIARKSPNSIKAITVDL